MRPHHIIAIVIVLVAGFAVKQLFSPTAGANVDTVNSPSVDVFKMHANTRLPVQKIDDMAFVFPAKD
jgi:hypothetical protein